MKYDKGIRQRKDGLWEARVRVGVKEDGSPDVPSKYFHTRAEAREYVAAVQRDRAAGTERKRTSYTVGTWAAECLRLYGPTLQDYTRTGYASKIRNYITPAAIAKVRMDQVTRVDLQRWVNSLRLRTGAAPSPKTVRLTLGVMTWLFSRAIEAGVLTVAPDTAHLRLPPATKPDRKVLSPDAAHALLASAQRTRIYAALVTDACTGLRRSELLGLSWRDINLSDGTYRVHAKVTLTDDGPRLVEMLKTRSAARVGVLPPAALAVLKEHRVRLKEERLKAGPLYRDRGLVFPDLLGNVTHPQAFSAALRRLSMQAIGQDVGLHQFRHLVATRLIRARLDDATIAAALGHRNADYTRRQYADVYDDSRQAVAAVMEDMIEGTL